MTRPEIYALVTINMSAILSVMATQSRTYAAATALVWTIAAAICLAAYLRSVHKRIGDHVDSSDRSEPPWT